MEWLKILILMFVCVNSDKTPYKSETNDWSIELKRDFDKFQAMDDFDVYWNVPTDKCSSSPSFETELKKFRIKFNSGGKFRGNEIVILYDPGAFPAMIKQSDGTITKRNGGIPQEGDIDAHLKAFADVINTLVPVNFDGLGVIDFEVWRPVFRQNWNDQSVYKDISVELVKNRTSSSTLTDKQVNDTAAQEFEEAAKKFMKRTLQKAKELRPGAKWGYYGYPYCYGFRVEWTPHCPDPVSDENDKIKWLFEESTALYPSIYVSSNLTTKEQEGFYIAKMNEASRMVESVSKGKTDFPPVYPYFWVRYNNNDTFLSQTDTEQAFKIISKYKMGGMIIWGSSDNVKTEDKCKNLLGHVEKVLGPAILKVTVNKGQNSDQSLGTSDKSQK